MYIGDNNVSRVSVKEARENFRALLDRVVQGDEVVILRRGKEVARLVPPRRELRRLPSLEAFRNSIGVKGKSLSAEVVRGRREERY
jgi:prevent-host-death family protein